MGIPREHRPLLGDVDDFGTVLADEPLSGIAERVVELGFEDDDKALEQLKAGFTEAGVPLPAPRGGEQVTDALRRIVGRVRNRTLIDDLGDVEVSFDVLALHVPEGGTAAMRLSERNVSDRQLSLSALGFGFGNGRKLTIDIDQGIPERESCMRVIQHAVAHVRRYASGSDADDVTVTTDVLRFGRREPQPWIDCPYCGEHAPDEDDFIVETDKALDLRNFDADWSGEESYTLEGGRSAEIGFAVAAQGIGPMKASFRVDQQRRVACIVCYRFPAGRCFVPYRPREDPTALP